MYLPVLPRIVSVALLGFALSMLVLVALNFAGIDGPTPMIAVVSVVARGLARWRLRSSAFFPLHQGEG